VELNKGDYLMTEITKLIVALIKDMVVVVGFFDIFTRTRLFQNVVDKKLTLSDKISLIVIFGLFSIFGTLGGELYKEVYINVRDMGPALAGLLGGPLVGLGAGLIGGIHRYTMGGLTCNACSISTILIGLAGGLIYNYRKGEFISVRGIVIFAILMEIFHLGLGLLISRPFDQVLILLEYAALPMIFNNALGMALAGFIVLDMIQRQREPRKQDDTKP
jgi:sigma-B regulation protein RsbU (phosphoserine phosphatase)